MTMGIMRGEASIVAAKMLHCKEKKLKEAKKDGKWKAIL